MDKAKRAVLQLYQPDIMQDLDVIYIIDDLFTKNAIKIDDLDHIYNLSDRVDRVRYLLDTLIQTGTDAAFEAFVDTLAKDYRWLWEKLVCYDPGMLNHSFEDSLSRGDVPRLPEHYVRRVEVDRIVTEKLKLLTRHNFLVLHGMSGSGKTSIVTGVLRDNPELITNNFNGAVFWLNFGNCKTEDDIIAQQNKLYRKALSLYVSNSFMNSSISVSSIGSNGDSTSLSGYELTLLDMRDRLKIQFSEKKDLNEALLVLDEVNEKKVVEAFDIGCKTLITTRDTEVVTRVKPDIITVQNSFTESETLELFASCLGVTVNQLPRQARKLHDICKGSTFNIGLIGALLAENRERLLDDRSHWNEYVKMLEKKGHFFSITKSNNKPMKTIEMCIKTLDPNILPLFKKLAVLAPNSKVTAIVLSRLWNKEVNETTYIMKQLRSKSLIIEFYDRDQRNYIYEIHDLIMEYLRSSIGDEDMKKLHSELLKGYNYKDVTQVPVELVDDGYIAFYIGYHIYTTKNLNGKWSLFPKLYLDLKFLGNKVRLTGIDDVVSDLEKYEKFIVQDELDRKLLDHTRLFLSAHGVDLCREPRTELLQAVLQHEARDRLYTEALRVAKEKCEDNELYFEFLHEQNVEEIIPSSIDVMESIESVGFLRDYALVGTSSGIIKFFHLSTNKLKKELTAVPNTPVKWVGACPVNAPAVAALCGDGCIKVWYIDDIVTVDDQDDAIEEEPEDLYNNNYPSNITIPAKRGSYINCRWANTEEVLMTHTNKLIVQYTPTGDIVRFLDVLTERDREILCCVPCDKDKHAIVATSNGFIHNIEVYNLLSSERVMCFDESGFVLDIFTVPDSNRILTLKAKEVQEFELSSSISYKTKCQCTPVIRTDSIKDNLTFITAAVNKAGTVLFVSTDDSRVICVDLKSNTRMYDLDNRRGNVITLAVSEVLEEPISLSPGIDVLAAGCGGGENAARVWPLPRQHPRSPGKVRLTTMFDVSFLHTMSPQTPVSTKSGSQSVASTPKRIQSFSHNNTDVEKPTVKVSLSLDRHSLKPLVLKGCNGNVEDGVQPLLAVVDDKNNIQVMRGLKVITEIQTQQGTQITTIKISPCNQYILYGQQNGHVNKYTLRTKESKVIMDIYSPVEYLNFVSSRLMMVAGTNSCFMAYRLMEDGNWLPEMLQAGNNTHLGSQELLNDIQGKRKPSPPERLSNSDSDSSLGSKERTFSNGLFKSSGLVDCFWLDDIGLITIERYATIKLWNKHLKLTSVLNGRQIDRKLKHKIVCTAFQNNRLAICDDNKGFQTFEIQSKEGTIRLSPLQEYTLNNRVTAAALGDGGRLLALGLDSGDVLLWNVTQKRQLRLLKQHKTKVQSVVFSPYPLTVTSQFGAVEPEEETPPLVLVTMASEIVWWNVTQVIKMRSKAQWRSGMNVVTPSASPLSPRTELTAALDNISLNTGSNSTCGRQNNFFFGNPGLSARDCWRSIWKGKTYKAGSKRKEILSCIKLSGMNAKRLCHDEQFSTFVTVDNPGHVHIMTVMRPNT